jgi:hypothetical protein
MFSTLIYFAFRNRSNCSVHKRLILIGTRFARDVLVCCYPLLLLLTGYDRWSTGKIQRVTLRAGAFLVVVQTERNFIRRTFAWQGLLRGCIRTRVVFTKGQTKWPSHFISQHAGFPNC